jgi:hypothetical protein
MSYYIYLRLDSYPIHYISKSYESKKGFLLKPKEGRFEIQLAICFEPDHYNRKHLKTPYISHSLMS